MLLCNILLSNLTEEGKKTGTYFTTVIFFSCRSATLQSSLPVSLIKQKSNQWGILGYGFRKIRRRNLQQKAITFVFSRAKEPPHIIPPRSNNNSNIRSISKSLKRFLYVYGTCRLQSLVLTVF